MELVNPFDVFEFPNVNAGHQYAIDVVEGKILACKYVIGACQRYLNDLAKEDADFKFDPHIAERYLRLVQQFEHVIGDWPTKNIIYNPWQNFCWMNIIGFISKSTGYRRFRVAHIEVPRGNAKSAMASQACLYFLALDKGTGNQISTVATRREQARIVLDSARAMAEKSKSYISNTGVKVRAHDVVHKKSNSKLRALSADHTGLDGLNDVLAVCDELHAMRRDTFDVISSGMSKRKDSLILCITTAGFDIESVGATQSEYAKKVCTGGTTDDQFFAIVYTIDEGDDIHDERTWMKANPGYGSSVDPVTFGAKSAKAKEVAADLPNFKVKHLNIWLSEASAFYSQTKWDLCADPTLRLEDFKGQACRIGVDKASHLDLTSVGYVFKKDDKYVLFDKSFIPEETVKTSNNDIYKQCIASGHLIQTPGESIDQDAIRKTVLADSKIFRIQEGAYDPWNAIELGQGLTKEKVNMLEFRMNVQNLSEPTKQLDTLMRQGRIIHNGSPLLRWCLGNVVCKRDHVDNVFPRKNHEKLKIDPIIALLMALALYLQDEKKESIYNTRPMRFI